MTKATDSFAREFRGHLNRHTRALESALRAVATAAPIPGASTVAYWIKPDWREFPVRTIAIADGWPDDILIDMSSLFREVVEGAGEMVPDGAIDRGAYEAAGVPTDEAAARVVAEWFGECWHAAGGAEFPWPAFLMWGDDGSSYYDLQTRRWAGSGLPAGGQPAEPVAAPDRTGNK
jgi:hypothetical protein